VPRPRGAGEQPPAGPLGSRVAAQLRVRFRLPDRHDPAPHPARLAGICFWAVALALLGLPVAGRCSVAIITGAAPAWFEPVVVLVGVLGILVTASTFAAIHRRWLPWLLLVAATGLLGLNLSITLTL
jgi:hypothetical protein